MTAAAYAKDLLDLIHPNRVEALKKMDVLSDISEGLAGIVRKQNIEYRNDVLKWLTPTDYASQQHDQFSSRQPGTGSTILEISAKGEDVRKYLDDHMNRLPNFVCEDAELKSEVETTIINSVQGMYGASTDVS
ncbi:hypothetical protein ACHAPE_003027 [Trichoderma viride]